MSSGQPLWLTIILGVVPLAAAVVAGVFALTTTTDRRINRLKTLLDIHKELPDLYNYDLALDRLMLEELRQIDIANAPWVRWRRRVVVIWAVALFVFAQLITTFAQWAWVRSNLWTLLGCMFLATAAVGSFDGIAAARQRRLDVCHDRRMEMPGVLRSQKLAQAEYEAGREREALGVESESGADASGAAGKGSGSGFGLADGVPRLRKSVSDPDPREFLDVYLYDEVRYLL